MCHLVCVCAVGWCFVCTVACVKQCCHSVIKTIATDRNSNFNSQFLRDIYQCCCYFIYKETYYSTCIATCAVTIIVMPHNRLKIDRNRTKSSSARICIHFNSTQTLICVFEKRVGSEEEREKEIFSGNKTKKVIGNTSGKSTSKSKQSFVNDFSTRQCKQESQPQQASKRESMAEHSRTLPTNTTLCLHGSLGSLLFTFSISASCNLAADTSVIISMR